MFKSKSLIPLFLVSIIALYALNSQAQTPDYKQLKGVVKAATNGNPINKALVILVGKGVYTWTDASGAYSFANGGIKITSTPITTQGVNFEYNKFSITKGVVSFNLLKTIPVRIDLYDLKGRLIFTPVNRNLPAGPYAIRINDAKLATQVYVLRATLGSKAMNFKFLPGITSKSEQIQKQIVQNSGLVEYTPADRSGRPIDVVRISEPGYQTKVTPLENYTNPVDANLDTLNNKYGNSARVDGAFDRMMVFGKAKYFWGLNDQNDTVPMVKSITAVTEKCVDFAIIFNKGFVDNTYGKNIIGWKTNGHGHTYEHLVKSDHVWLAAMTKTGDSAFSGKIDYIHGIDSTIVPSGYTCLGPYGGDGALYKGSPSDIISFGSSLDENVNFYGYRLFVDSPKTDSLYTPNPDYPFWEFYVIYRITLRANAFGAGGTANFDKVVMETVHASPSKYSNDTVIIFDKISPIVINPFIQVISIIIPDIDK